MIAAMFTDDSVAKYFWGRSFWIFILVAVYGVVQPRIPSGADKGRIGKSRQGKGREGRIK